MKLQESLNSFGTLAPKHNPLAEEEEVKHGRHACLCKRCSQARQQCWEASSRLVAGSRRMGTNSFWKHHCVSAKRQGFSFFGMISGVFDLTLCSCRFLLCSVLFI